MTGEKALAADVGSIGQQLRDVFETVGFAYLVNCPLSFSHDEVFTLAREFFDLPPEEKMAMAKRSFQPQNQNTYRGCVALNSTISCPEQLGSQYEGHGALGSDSPHGLNNSIHVHCKGKYKYDLAKYINAITGTSLFRRAPIT